MTKKILNLENTGWKTGQYPLFLGEELGLHDSMNRPYPELFSLFKKLKSLDWSEDEVNLAQDRMDFETCDKSTYDIMIKTLSWQYEGDSVASRSIISLFAPFISNSDLSQMMVRWSDNEGLHALTYSEIVRQCLKSPEEVFEEITSNKNITSRSAKIVEALSDLQIAGAKYILDRDSMTDKEYRTVIMKALVCLYCLEQMEFMGSFACTFAQAERELFLGVASYVQKIMIDETIHTKMDEAILDILMQEEEWRLVYLEIRAELQEIVDSIYFEEVSWSEYIFSEGRSIIGLNTPLLIEWVQYKSQVVYDKLGLDKPFKHVDKNPLVWMDNWLDIDSQQVAAQEADITNYRLNSVVSDVRISSYDFGITRDEEIEELIVYSKDGCPFCVKLKGFLDRRGVAYVIKDVRESVVAKDFLAERGFTTVPQVFDKSGNYKGDCTSYIGNHS